jgi:hypothetical protein
MRYGTLRHCGQASTVGAACFVSQTVVIVIEWMLLCDWCWFVLFSSDYYLFSGVGPGLECWERLMWYKGDRAVCASAP